MKKALLFAAALGALSLPALAQQTPGGQSSGGPARVGDPGQIGGGVPGTRPGVVEQRQMTGTRMMRPRMKKRRAMRRRMKKKMM